MQLDTCAKLGWLGRVYRGGLTKGLTLLEALESESDSLQDRIKGGQIDTVSGNGFTTTYSQNGPSTAALASLAGEMILRHEWAVDTLTGAPDDAAIYAQMKSDMAMRPPSGGAREVHSDYTLLRC